MTKTKSGNPGNSSKLKAFNNIKSTSDSRGKAIANSITSALATRGNAMKVSKSPDTEPISPNTNTTKKK